MNDNTQSGTGKSSSFSGLPLLFVPAKPPEDLTLLSAAWTLACFGTEASFTELYVGNGDMRFGVRGKLLSDSEHQYRARRMVAGAAALNQALQHSELEALVSSSRDGGVFKVPGYYWWSVSLVDGDDLKPISSIPDHLIGQPVMVDRAASQKWRDVVDAECERVNLIKPDGQNVEPGVSPARQTRTITPVQKRLGKFFALADRNEKSDLVGRVLYAEYERFNNRENDTKLNRKLPALQYSAFKKWRSRWRKGERWS